MHRKDILIAIQIPYSIEYLTWTILLFLCARKKWNSKAKYAYIRSDYI